MSDVIVIPDPPQPAPAGGGRGRGSETIIVVRKPQVDKLKPTPAAEQRFDIRKCVVIPRVSNENGNWVQIDGYTVYAPPGSDVLAEDEVICRGARHSVIGKPGDLRNARGKRKVLAITLERVG